MGASKDIVEALLAKAGVRVNGNKPWDIRVRDERLYARVLARRNLGLGEAYMDGWWECERIDKLIDRVLRAGLDRTVNAGWRTRLASQLVSLWKMLPRTGFGKLMDRHYNLSRELFLSFLDPYNQYSCGCFDGTSDLDQAQRKKMEMICRKADIREGERVLDIGCGFGGLARYMAETRGCEVTAVNISDEQLAHAREFCRGMPVTVKKQDYRELDPAEPFDKIVSVGMFEHVGARNHRTFFRVARRCLADCGAFVLQTIGGNRAARDCDPWISTYIFPQGALPGVRQIGKAVEGLFVMEDWHNLGPHYDKTLMAWHGNFREAWPRLQKTLGPQADERFYRMWEYYLLSCAGAFRARAIQLWQIVLTPVGADQPPCRA